MRRLFSLYSGSLLKADANTGLFFQAFSVLLYFSPFKNILQEMPSPNAFMISFLPRFSGCISYLLGLSPNKSSLSLNSKPQEFFQRYNSYFSLLNNGKL